MRRQLDAAETAEHTSEPVTQALEEARHLELAPATSHTTLVDATSRSGRSGTPGRTHIRWPHGRARSLPEDVVARIVTDSEAGSGPTAIARALNARGVPTAHGGTEWRASSVAAVLRSTTGRRLAGQPA